MKWMPINTYDQIGKKALFCDEDGFIFIGAGTCERYRGLEFTDFEDFYEPTHWMELPDLPNSNKFVLIRETMADLEKKPRRSPGKSLNRFNLEEFQKLKNGG